MTDGVNDRQPRDEVRLFLVGSDPIFQLGLRTGLEQDPTFQVLGVAPSASAFWSVLATSPNPDLFVLDLDPLGVVDTALIELCRQLKSSAPQPILVLTGRVEPEVLSQLRQTGVEGYAAKGTDFASLGRTLRALMQGDTTWSTVQIAQGLGQGLAQNMAQKTGLSRLKAHLRQTSLQHIQGRRQQLAQSLEDERITWWEWVVLSGQLREVNAAQGLVEALFPATVQEGNNGLFSTSASRTNAFSTNTFSTNVSGKNISSAIQAGATATLGPMNALNRILPRSSSAQSVGQGIPDSFASEDAYRTIKTVVLDQLTSKLTLASGNLTGTPLESDLLRVDRKQELFLIVLKRFEDLLDELRFSDLTRSQIYEKRSQMLLDLWQNSLTDFLGKYRTLAEPMAPGATTQTGVQYIEVVPLLLQDAALVEEGILRQIPLFVELVEHLLFHSDLRFDQQLYPVGSVEAFLQIEALLGHGVIQVANAIVQPLVNRFSSHEAIRQDFFDRRWLSTRELERFRNALSWKYRVQQWFVEPKAIFESQYRLMVFSETGIKYRAIYAPRDRELQSLSGLPFVITLALEARDAIAPPVQAAVTFVGRGFVYVLTQVIGRSIGLVGRGILQGIGYVRSEVRTRSPQSPDPRQP